MSQRTLSCALATMYISMALVTTIAKIIDKIRDYTFIAIWLNMKLYIFKTQVVWIWNNWKYVHKMSHSLA
jgi:hypothetical protein